MTYVAPRDRERRVARRSRTTDGTENNHSSKTTTRRDQTPREIQLLHPTFFTRLPRVPTRVMNPADDPAELFVCGRLCLLGEHSDWAGGFRSAARPDTVHVGRCVVVGTNDGLRARVSTSSGSDMCVAMTSTDDAGAKRSRVFDLYDDEALLRAARGGADAHDDGRRLPSHRPPPFPRCRSTSSSPARTPASAWSSASSSRRAGTSCTRRAARPRPSWRRSA